MSPVTAIVLASLGGAVLFLVAGYLLRLYLSAGGAEEAAKELLSARARHEASARLLGERERELEEARARGRELQDAAARCEQERGAARARCDELTKKVESLGVQVAELETTNQRLAADDERLRSEVASAAPLRAELERHRREQLQARAQLDKATAELRSSAAALAQLRAQHESDTGRQQETAAALARATAEAAACRDELERTKVRLHQATQAAEAASALRNQLQELDAQDTRWREVNARLADEIAGTRAELLASEQLRRINAELQGRLEQAESRVVTLETERRDAEELARAHWRREPEEQDEEDATVHELRQRERELLLKLQLLNQRVQELKHHAEENLVLRAQVQSLDAEARRSPELERKVHALEAELLASTIGRRQGPVATHRPRAHIAQHDTLGATMDQQLAQLVHGRHCEVAVLADVKGLLLAAAGEPRYHDTVAALGGLMEEMAQRAREFLPLGEPTLVEIADSNGLGLRARIFPWEKERLALTTLGMQSMLPEPAIEAVVSAVPIIMGGQAATGSARS